MHTQTITANTTPVPADVIDIEELEMDESSIPAQEQPQPVAAKPKLSTDEKLAAARDREKQRIDARKAKEKEAAESEKKEKATLDAAEKRIKAALSKSGGSIVEIGEELARVKSNIKPGTFSKWTANNLKMTYRSVTNYIYSAEAVGDIRALVSADKHDSIYALPPTILYGWHKLDDDAKQEIASKIEAGEIVKALPRKAKAEATGTTTGEDDDNAADTTVRANDPDTDAGKELARQIAALLNPSQCKNLRILSGFEAIGFGKLLQSAMTSRMQP